MTSIKENVAIQNTDNLAEMLNVQINLVDKDIKISLTFMPIFLPFITLHSIIFIFGLMSTSIPSLSSGILRFF